VTGQHAWLDGDAGPVVRPYTMTGGRVHAGGGFDVVALVVANAVAPMVSAGLALQPEHRAILAAAREPMAVAEVAARVDLALGVVRVLLGDLLVHGLVTVYHPPLSGKAPSDRVLRAVLHGLRAL
jgi:hypothetical protein